MADHSSRTGLFDSLSAFLEEEAAPYRAADKGVPPPHDFETPQWHPGDQVPVLVPLPSEQPYSYLVAENMLLQPGDVVKVPLGARTVIGMVWDETNHHRLDPKKLKPVIERLSVPPIATAMRRFIDWVARYTLSSPGHIANMVLRLPLTSSPEKSRTGVRLTTNQPARLSDARKRVLEQAANGLIWTKAALAENAAVSVGVVDGLIKAGVLETALQPAPPIADKLDADFNPAKLFEDQKRAGEALRKAVRSQGASITLIDGVTGSGKTEVYFEAVKEALRQGKQVLILVPEISLTGSFLDRFATRFGGKPTEWHSDITPRRREQVWRAVANGAVQVVVGARSALFLPFQNLGLIIVDEEHDMAYKQEERVLYHARDMAVVRGHLEGFPVMLASATPSLETFVNARNGRYQKVTLKSRYSHAALPTLSAIDMRRDPPEKGRWLAAPLVSAMNETLCEGKQVLLFLNRRGYAPLTLCRLCGFRFQCPDCSSWLVEHRFRNTIDCHHCGFSSRKPEGCRNCEAQDSLVACGPGVERIHEEVCELFPKARSIVLSSDMFSTAKQLKAELAAIERGQADIIIGTQLVAKGHNFPKLALVGVVDADLGLGQGDLRAAERTFQMLSQVTGRAGRAGGRSKALLQSYAPDHAVMKAILKGDRDEFYTLEASLREQHGMPPFGRLVAFIISAKDKPSLMQYAQHLRAMAPSDPRILVLGPSEAPLAMIRGRHRARLLIQAPKKLNIQSYIKNWLSLCQPMRGSVQLKIDIDPQSFW